MIAFRRKFFNFASKSHKRMDYNNNSHIESIKDVTLFFDYLVNDRKVNFNPDNDSRIMYALRRMSRRSRPRSASCSIG